MAEAGTKVREADLIPLLDQRYTRVRPYTTADRYIRAAQVRSTQGLDGCIDDQGRWQSIRIADYLVIDKYRSRQSMHGFEIKVSRADWLSELRQPEKSEYWRRYCNYWWIVASDKTVVKPEELPRGYGLLVATSTMNSLRCKVEPFHTESSDLPLDLVAGIAYAAQMKPHAMDLKGVKHG